MFGEETGHPGLGTPAVEFEGGVQLLTADDHQIGQRIVEAIPVLVVNHFAGKKSTSQGLLDHETVLRDSLASPRVNHRLVGLVALFAPYLLSRFHSSVVLVLGVTEIHFCFWALGHRRTCLVFIPQERGCPVRHFPEKPDKLSTTYLHIFVAYFCLKRKTIREWSASRSLA